FLQPLGLVHPKTTVLLLPPVVRLLRHTNLAAHLGNLLTPRQLNLRFTQLANNLRRSKLLSSWHRLSSFACDLHQILAPVVVSFEGAGHLRMPGASGFGPT